MGIGVSYTGYDGKTRHSVVQNAADLPRFMGTESRAQPPAAKTPRIGDLIGKVNQQDPVDGPLVGIEGNGSPEPDGQFRAVGSRGGFRLPFSRTEIEVAPSMIMGCNEVTLTKLEYNVIFSEKGLAKGRTEERVVWKKSFFVLAEAKQASDGAKYGVRPTFDENGVLQSLAFGTDAELDAATPGGNVQIVETTTCPNAE